MKKQINDIWIGNVLDRKYIVSHIVTCKHCY